MLEKKEKKIRRHKRVRAKISGTGKIPRLCVFRSLSHIYVQFIDDQKGKTLLALNDTNLDSRTKKGINGKVSLARELGKLAAKKALENKIEKVVFDRGGYKYHGRVKALAEGAREGGLKF